MSSQNVRAAMTIVIVALLLGAIAGSYATARTGRALFATTQAIKAPGAAIPAADQVSFAEGFAPVVKRTIAAVVNIAS
jgi:hypothetical protein